MIIGCVKEVKNAENRVGLMPSHVFEYVNAGHSVFVERDLGIGSGFNNQEYRDAGATVLDDAKAVWDLAEMMIKVKEPMASEYDLMKPDSIIFTYFHLADNKPLASVLLEKRISAVAYETVTDANGRLPLLRPMSEVAGRLSIQEGEKYLEGHYGGKGILLSGVPGVRGGHVVIIGAGVVGTSAVKTALGTGATVSVLDRDLNRLAYLEDVFNGQISTIYSDETNLRAELMRADIVVGSVLIPGDKAPKIVRREHLALMGKGTVLIDVAIDQGGCFETSRPTSHVDPIFIEEGIVHYCVTNMPGAVPKTSTYALGNATLPYGLKIANLGLHDAIMSDVHLKDGLNTFGAQVTNRAVAKALNLEFVDYEKCVKYVKS
ncbi:alanine dehydrogenase [Erysipelothrix sp. HDW6C]|uniref:alanine dehydrogenase n=1 Tax=Erysipelothrix sp. HDW6C TaxID=2714930 RepID=UPI00140ABF36|nr:alanine dehydrogenase [Erysipelothrix sp. HDW6C]QIK69905.1 alanine dehydrogenase [Erysipelothrix sp. HDW6C]